MSANEALSLQARLGTVLTLTKTQASRCEKAGFFTLADLLCCAPLRYEDRTQITPLAELGAQQEREVLIRARVQSSKIIRGRSRPLFQALLSDGQALCGARFFNFSDHTTGNYRNGREGLFFGKVHFNGYEQLFEMNHPKVNWLDDLESAEFSPSITPIYPSRAHFKSLADLRRQALELLPPGPLREALRQLHQPDSLAAVATARQQLAEQELLAHVFALERARQQRQTLRAVPLVGDDSLLRDFRQQLPFAPTPAQEKVMAEIAADLAQPRPMMRLVQGDVGSGKTLVALYACLRAVAAGKQACILAPTELLARQHFQSCQRLLGTLPVAVVLLTSKKREALPAIADGSAQIIVGTHALFQDKVSYADLALVVIDEQHRFGVEQRLRLRNKSSEDSSAHQLLLTATPIPRTLAMSHYGALDLSVIDSLPAGRAPVKTSVFNAARRAEIIQRVGENCRQGRQAYWVCPLIGEGDGENVETTAAQLREALPDITIEVLHGQLPSDQRQAIMERFLAGEIALLVATTVIEVGVDVPNASLMVIENAERFGLAQLHQLRGRVGRGQQASHCVLLYQELTEVAQQRLQLMRSTNNGFLIAEADFELRGAGEMVGKRQTGGQNFYFVDFPRDKILLERARAQLDLDSAEQQMIYNQWALGADDYWQS